MLSIIVPVYNTAKYLERCLNSLVNQAASDLLEVIIVNDGSTDNSQKIIELYTLQYPDLFRSFIKPNGGLSDARNFGLRYVTGEYLAFLDSDDWVDRELYASCINFLDMNHNAEFVNFNYLEECGSSQKLVDCRAKIGRSKYFMTTTAWSKVFRTSFWQQYQFQFKFGIKHEDTELIPKVIYYAKHYGFLGSEHGLLHYDRTNQSSITKSCRDTKSWIIVLESLLEFCQDKYDADLTKFVATTLFYQLILFGGNPELSYQMYCLNRKLFSAENVISRPHKILKLIQAVHADFLLQPIIYLLHKLSIDPNGFSV